MLFEQLQWLIEKNTEGLSNLVKKVGIASWTAYQVVNYLDGSVAHNTFTTKCLHLVRSSISNGQHYLTYFT